MSPTRVVAPDRLWRCYLTGKSGRVVFPRLNFESTYVQDSPRWNGGFLLDRAILPSYKRCAGSFELAPSLRVVIMVAHIIDYSMRGRYLGLDSQSLSHANPLGIKRSVSPHLVACLLEPHGSFKFVLSHTQPKLSLTRRRENGITVRKYVIRKAVLYSKPHIPPYKGRCLAQRRAATLLLHVVGAWLLLSDSPWRNSLPETPVVGAAHLLSLRT
ncbi:hypothetical protein EDB81DRAFT_463901 [Dactylonectria macrodidyma]|uniref:Uncharacterized protein n=1 Tax=Dactylonectria macrodidyma TaxID=307937 RepID=A0A9P9J7M0_9HYPO|nr:hypothetical protein EDB81DRAFT_463901 [Dactylonectria macrodidyma]